MVDQRIRARGRTTQPGTPASSKARWVRGLVAMVAAVALSSSGSVFVVPTATAAPTDPVVFTDSALEDAINDRLGRAPGTTVTEADASSIVQLPAANAGITDLGGIEYLDQLRLLNLDGNDIADISPLSGLTELEQIELRDNSITDISPLSGLDQLRLLYLDDNSIADISAVSSLTQLEKLGLNNNSATDISPVSGLTNLTNLSVLRNGLSDISPVAGLTNLTYLNAQFNDIVDISSVAGLTNLTTLALGINDIVDVSAVTGLTDLTSLNFSGNDVADISAVAGLTDLTILFARNNSFSDISALSGLTKLNSVTLDDQNVTMPSAVVGSDTTNPVADIDGNPLPVTSSSSGFSYDSGANEWSFSSAGTKTLSWIDTTSVGNVSEVEFSGDISQEITPREQPGAATPQDPEVVQAQCLNGDIVGPQINLPTTEGIEYSIVGEVVPGGTVTVEAIPAEGYYLETDPNSDWEGDSDGIYAELEITLDEVECDEPITIDAPNGDLPVDDPCGPDNATWILPSGEDVPENFTWRVVDDGLLVAEANPGYLFSAPDQELDAKFKEYGYAPDTDEPCPPVSDDDPAPTGGTVTTQSGVLPSTGADTSTTLLGVLGSALFVLGAALTIARRRTVRG